MPTSSPAWAMPATVSSARNKNAKCIMQNAKLRAPRLGCPQRVENPLRGFPPDFLQSAARIICSLTANKFHTCSLRSIFVHVHAAAKNVLKFICHCRGKLCEAYKTMGTPFGVPCFICGSMSAPSYRAKPNGVGCRTNRSHAIVSGDSTLSSSGCRCSRSRCKEQRCRSHRRNCRPGAAE